MQVWAAGALKQGAQRKNIWRGNSNVFITEAGQTMPLHVWTHKKEIEAGLAVSGFTTTISGVGTIIAEPSGNI
jgi:hypothetical protein